MGLSPSSEAVPSTSPHPRATPTSHHHIERKIDPPASRLSTHNTQEMPKPASSAREIQIPLLLFHTHLSTSKLGIQMERFYLLGSQFVRGEESNKLLG